MQTDALNPDAELDFNAVREFFYLDDGFDRGRNEIYDLVCDDLSEMHHGGWRREDTRGWAVRC